MTDNQKIILSFIAGAAAGTALGLYITSDQGQETIEQTRKKLKELETDFSENLEKQIHELNDNVNELMGHMQERGEEVFESTLEKVKEKLPNKNPDAKTAVTEGGKSAGSEAKS